MFPVDSNAEQAARCAPSRSISSRMSALTTSTATSCARRLSGNAGTATKQVANLRLQAIAQLFNLLGGGQSGPGMQPLHPDELFLEDILQPRSLKRPHLEQRIERPVQPVTHSGHGAFVFKHLDEVRRHLLNHPADAKQGLEPHRPGQHHSVLFQRLSQRKNRIQHRPVDPGQNSAFRGHQFQLRQHRAASKAAGDPLSEGAFQPLASAWQPETDIEPACVAALQFPAPAPGRSRPVSLKSALKQGISRHAVNRHLLQCCDCRRDISDPIRRNARRQCRDDGAVSRDTVVITAPRYRAPCPGAGDPRRTVDQWLSGRFDSSRKRRHLATLRL